MNSVWCAGLLSALLAPAADPPGGPKSTESAPASSNVRGAEYPRIHDDLRVTFRIKAPEAQKVEFDPAKRKEKAITLERYILDQVFTMPVYRTVRLLPIANKVKNVDVAPAHIYYGDLSEVWLAP